MALFPLGEEIFSDPLFFFISVGISLAIGAWQGKILGKAILLRFPKLQKHAKITAVSLFFLFLINALLSIPRFASSEKIDLESLFHVQSPLDVGVFLFTVFGIGTGFLAIIAISVTVFSLVLLKMTHLNGFSKFFVLTLSIFVLLLSIVSRFTDMTPSTFEIFFYFLYQFGITIGIVFGSARKIRNVRT